MGVAFSLTCAPRCSASAWVPEVENRGSERASERARARESERERDRERETERQREKD